jgi:hypothetical protein
LLLKQIDKYIIYVNKINMTQLHPLSITNKYLTFENINQLELSNDEYVIASKTKIKKFLKIVSFNETHFITNNENIDIKVLFQTR